MMTFYFCLNLSLMASYLFMRLVPLGRYQFSSQVKIARTVFAVSLLSVCVVWVLPSSFFPDSARQINIVPAELVAPQDLEVPAIELQIANQAVLTAKAQPLEVSIWSVLITLLLLGLILQLGRFGSQMLRLRGFIAQSICLHKITRVGVYASSNIEVPFSAWLLGKACVVFPARLVQHPQEFKLALRHEVQHHRARDTHWIFFAELLVRVFYLNPFAYFWRDYFTEIQELACDETLISQMRISRRDYGSCLLTVAEMALGKTNMYAGTSCMISLSRSKAHSFLKRRILMFTDHERANKKKSVVAIIGAGCSAAIASVVYLTAAIAQDSANRINPGTPVFHPEIQAETQEILEKGLAKYSAMEGFAIVANSETGEVLAAAEMSKDTSAEREQFWSLNMPSHPASGLKPILVATAVENGATELEEVHDCENGSFEYAGRVLKDYKAFGRLTTKQAVVMSSNICTLKSVMSLSGAELESGLRLFGFENKLDYPMAASGSLTPSTSVSDEEYHHGVSHGKNLHVTSLEMVRAYSAIANGGVLLNPVNLGDLTNAGGNIVISKRTSQGLRETLREAVLNGTGKSIRNSDVALAGKTSTLNFGSKKQRRTGFIGFAPADDPKLVAYVVVIDPRGKNRMGSNTAAPIFRDVIEAALDRM